MVLVLCIGDLHIPHRAADLPPKFKELLKPGKIHTTICVGNVCSKVFLDYLRTISGDLHVVAGDFDEFPAPDQLILDLAGFKVGVVHGHQIVPWADPDATSLLQRQMGVDILLTGNTHRFEARKAGTCVTLNPGSATGAYAVAGEGAATPSFVLMDLDGSKVTVYVYQLVDGEVRVEKIDYTKGAAA
ncbi:hypothetical protein PLESTB_001444200 [Pleodorina starrii]|uniref:Vacuolar protein sorting-associated protein 29 n=1 Tax=Pleodorina starrii TaxID=330485 RepID=A0A9W6F7Z9_9CHLO|nr:hypothetical protein PLESTM_001791900 [Pleodorina starrii]GLC59071.1 hypothetical protein PLESTB_001444200 [Pleodorina starrii]GLC68307.1 hypothetical protein PLESTF_000675300 [Pleodorina starrii]GLC70524.1 hypothetical protein PLESTF_000995800 [Pleodorina starrii]